MHGFVIAGINLDGLTDRKDISYITRGKFPRECPDPKPRKGHR
jgi:hypothetical protein